ncbi:helix-turn-helix domain-containing protein [Paenibacillus hemerocallicola]|uniref:helix-turn-helix domain-containing protein n=1 Tax=Paenibacillus hemerocallicola TaxID=1172614 RepID=UPI00159EC417|nr:transcriptional regulator [Paenibacillus hemerocallicola]
MEALEFGQYLKSLRKTAKLSMAVLAEQSGVSQPYISQIERGERGIPSPEILKKLSTALNTPYTDLMAKAGFLPADTTASMDRLNSIKSFWAEYQQATSQQIQADKKLESTNRELQIAEYELLFLEEMERVTELTEFLQKPGITYKGSPLFDHDKKRIAGVIEYLFAEERGK